MSNALKTILIKKRKSMGKGKGKGVRERRSSPQKAQTRKMPKQRRFQVQKLKPTIPTTNA